jgi:hypothetical protein
MTVGDRTPMEWPEVRIRVKIFTIVRDGSCAARQQD